MKKIIPIFIASLLLVACTSKTEKVKHGFKNLQEIIDYAYEQEYTDSEKHLIDSTHHYYYEMVRLIDYSFEEPSYDTIINYTHFTITPDE